MNADSKPQILNVDDNSAMRCSTSRILREAGFEVQEAATGEDALRLVALQPDLILLDVNLPDISGLEVCRRIKADTRWRHIPVVHLSATFVSADDQATGLAQGADGYLTHPVYPSVLVATVNAFLRLKTAEKDLRESEARLRLLVQSGNIGLWDWDIKTNTVYFSPEWKSQIGYRDDEITNHFDEWQNRVHPDDLAPALQKVQEYIADPDPQGRYEIEFRLRHRDGSYRWIYSSADLVRDADGKPVRMLGCHIDITERKKTEEALCLKNEELIHFNYTVSHDLKSPLVTIKTFLGYLEQDMAEADSKHVAQDVAYIHAAADKMNALLQELLALSRIGRIVNPPVKTTLQKIVQEALTMVAGSIDRRGVRVAVTENPVLLYGDRIRLVEVFQNLVDNAVKFMGDQSEPAIEIGAETKDGEVVCFVRDNGMGIDARHKDKLFGLFEKLNPEIEGTGLGLALVKRIVEVHGGRIWVESEGVGKGACFWFALPEKSSES